MRIRVTTDDIPATAARSADRPLGGCPGSASQNDDITGRPASVDRNAAGIQPFVTIDQKLIRDLESCADGTIPTHDLRFLCAYLVFATSKPVAVAHLREVPLSHKPLIKAASDEIVKTISTDLTSRVYAAMLAP